MKVKWRGTRNQVIVTLGLAALIVACIIIRGSSADYQFERGKAIQFNGDRSTESYAEAIQWYLLAAERGNIDAHYELAWLYSGQGACCGIKENYQLAYYWLLRLGDQTWGDPARHREEFKNRLTIPQIEAAEQEVAAWKFRLLASGRVLRFLTFSLSRETLKLISWTASYAILGGLLFVLYKIANRIKTVPYFRKLYSVIFTFWAVWSAYMVVSFLVTFFPNLYPSTLSFAFISGCIFLLGCNGYVAFRLWKEKPFHPIVRPFSEKTLKRISVTTILLLNSPLWLFVFSLLGEPLSHFLLKNFLS